MKASDILKVNRLIPFSPPDISQLEIDGVIEVLKSGWITTGPKTKEFERKIATFCETTKVNCLNSATAAMEMCLRMLGVGPGDEVITTAYTYTASASVIHHVGAKIVMVDTAPGSYFPSAEQIEAAITDKTKVVLTVDIAGKMADYDRIYEILENKRKLFRANNKIQGLFNRVIILADAAHSFGAEYNSRISGSVADFTSFSFHAVKNLTTTEGGALTWRPMGHDIDEEIYNTINTLSLHGQTKDALAKNQLGSWEYDIISPAYKCNMTDIQAAIGLAQFSRYESFISKRFDMINRYTEQLSRKHFKVIEHQAQNYKSSGHLLLTQFSSDKYTRDEFIIRMAEEGIVLNVHYKPLPMFTAYKNLGFNIDDYPNAYQQFINEVTFPLYSSLNFDDLNYIIETANRVLV